MKAGVQKQQTESVAVVVDGDFFAGRSGETGDAAPGAGFPVVGDFLREDPGRKVHEEEPREALQVGLVHFAEVGEFFPGGFGVAELEAGLRQGRAKPLQFGGG